jgi:hypothetical protein
MPNHKFANISELNPGWSLLSCNKTAEASSSLVANPVAYAFDENIGTFWSAKTGNKDEWLCVDLGSLCTVNAVQINFASTNTKLSGHEGVLAYQYLVEYSTDKQNWKTLCDKTNNTDDLVHPYEVMSIPVQARYVRITNYHVPDGCFAISGFRIFGTGASAKPVKVNSFYALRDFHDPHLIKLSWVKKSNSDGYNIKYGTQKDKLYHSYQVYKDSPVTFRVLDKSKTYWFEIDAFDENGVTPSDPHPSH